jgi:hypothetical protein
MKTSVEIQNMGAEQVRHEIAKRLGVVFHTTDWPHDLTAAFALFAGVADSRTLTASIFIRSPNAIDVQIEGWVGFGDNGIADITGSIDTIALTLCRAWLILKESEQE